MSWDGNYDDYFLVKLADGSRTKILDKEHFGATVSPGGQFILYFGEDDDNWYTVRVSAQSIRRRTDRPAGPTATTPSCSTTDTTSGKCIPTAGRRAC